jgi:hypothetical protein
MTNIIEQPLVSYEIMSRADSAEGVLFTELINDKILIARHENLDNLVAAIQRLIGLGMIEIEPVNDEEDGKDYRLFLSKTGSSLLDRPHT